jgi:hypothetical protein
MALWNTKFDHTNGETRECKECKETFHAKKPIWKCRKCVNASQKIIETKKRAKYQRKEPYPYQGPNHNYHSRFYPLRAKLHSIRVRQEWKEYFKERLDEILNDKVLMKWINDRRDKETAEARQVKSRKTITKDYPNTHDYYEY